MRYTQMSPLFLFLTSFGHFLIDLFCAWGMLRSVGESCWQDAALIYNFCAFALQMPLGLLADRFRSERAFAVVGTVLVFAACPFVSRRLFLFAIVAGIGNALYHVGGGTAVLRADPRHAGRLGLFVSPGAFGIFLGTLLGKRGVSLMLPCLILPLFALLLCICRKPAIPGDSDGPADPFLRTKSRLAVLCLFLVVALRSYCGFLAAFPWKTGMAALLFVCGVVLGKTLGGFLSDRMGATVASCLSLGLAALLFCFASRPLFGILAIFLFNMSMPITLRAAADAFPGLPGFSFGLLTFALFIGYLPAWNGWMLPCLGWVLALGTLVSLGLLLPGLRSRHA